MRYSAMARLAIMAFLTLALLVPITWVYTIVRERASRRDEATRDVSATWGGSQIVGGPVLSIPYVYTETDGAGRSRQLTAHAHVLPQDVKMQAALAIERRRRGIFDVLLYRAQLTVSGRFQRDALNWIKPAPDRIDWADAVLNVGTSDPRGLSRRVVLNWNGREEPFAGGVTAAGLFATGIHAKAPLSAPQPADAAIPFHYVVALNGTRDIQFLPAAEETIVEMTASWPHPSFAGGPLPEEWSSTRDGFVARWRVVSIGRPYAGRWTSADTSSEQLQARATASAFGVTLIQPVDIYQQAERAVKYCVLFLVLTFLVFFLWEIFRATLLHPVQYTFVGFGLCVFYLLLLSLSEHIGFDAAYALSATSITLMIGAYSRAVLKGTRQAGSIVASLALLYGFLYLLLRLEDYALLAGSIALVVVLAGLMYVTRRMDWYELRLGGEVVKSADR